MEPERQKNAHGIIKAVAQEKGPKENGLFVLDAQQKQGGDEAKGGGEDDVAGPSDWVDIDDSGNVTVNSEPLEEPYLAEKAFGQTNISLPYQVPEGRYFVMGDNRDASVDSRNTAVGPIAMDQVVGKVFFRIWPLREFGVVK